MSLSDTALPESPPGRQPTQKRTSTPLVAPLSHEQEQIWLQGVLAAGLPLCNETVTLCYRGDPDLALFESSLYTLCLRHGIMRTIIQEQDGVPAQYVGLAVPVRVESANLSSLPEEEKQRQTAELVAEFARRPFDLTRGPLFRVLAVRLGGDETRFYLTLHQLIFDGVSLRRILLPELIEIFSALSTNRKPSLLPQRLQYADYALTQQGRAGEDALTFWRAKLADLSPLTLPTDRARTPQTSFRGAVQRFAFDEEFSRLVREFAQRERTNIFSFFLASFTVLFARYSDTADVTLGTIYEGRRSSELEDVLGCFLNTLLLRTDLSGDLSFREVLAKIRDVMREAIENADVPFQIVVRECLKRTSSGEPPVQVVFSFQPPPPELPKGWDLDVFETSNGTAKFDLHLEIEEKDGAFRGRIHYNTDLFDTDTIVYLERHWTVLLQAAIREPQTSVWKLPLLAADEQVWLRSTLNRSLREFPQECIHDLFAKKAAEFPHRIAISCHGRSLTYRELDQASARLAHHLIEIGFDSGAIIGLMVERSTEMLVALLGILRAGATYVPMDPKYPPARLEHMLRASGAGLLLTQASLDARLPAVELPRIDVFEYLANGVSGAAAVGQLPRVSPSSSAYIIFTSGSTGIPKGVEIPHRALTNLLCSMQKAPGIEPDDVLLAITSICFDIAALELFLPPITGARIEMASAEEAADPEQLGAKIEQSGATILQATPVSWRMLVESGWTSARPIKILCGGEALTDNLARQLCQRSDSVWNMYGPTETTIWSACSRVLNGSPVTLGDPVANTTLYVLDSHRNLAPPGVGGELYIGGAGLAVGYHGQPDLTAERFPLVPFDDGEATRVYRTGDRVKRMPDGSLVFLGRTDRQIKFNGFRIELGEIEQVMNALEGVQESVVMKAQLPSGEEFLAGFIIPEVDAQVNLDAIRSGLSKLLPKYMQPAKLYVLTDVPLTPNGKLDRRRLPELIVYDEPLATEIAEAEKPLQGVEQALADIWCALLQLKAVGRRENFFDLGGHSLLAARFIAEANRTFSQTFTLTPFVQAPTIAQFAQLVGGHSVPRIRLAKRGSSQKKLLWVGADPWLMRLARHLREDLSMYTFTLDVATAPSTIEAMATQLVAHIREVQPHGPYVVGSYCIHGLLALEAAQQLQRSGEEIALLVLSDLYAPGRDPRWPSQAQRLIYRVRLEAFHFAWLIRWPLAEWGPYLRRRWQRILDHRRLANLGTACARDLQEALDAIESGYRSAPYSGKVLFLESDEGRLFEPTTSASWKDLVHDMDVFTYPGEHEAVLKEPHLGLAAERIQQAIDRALFRESLPSL